MSGRDSLDSAIAEARLVAVQRKISMLRGIQGTLQHLIHCCHGDDRPDCPILDELPLQALER